MNQQYLENLDNAKESLKIWFSSLKQKNLGNQLFSSEIEIDKSKTDFAQWYYGEGQTFSSFKAFRDIESYYDKMYDKFLEYDHLNKKPIKRGFFSNNTEKRKEYLNDIFKKIKSSYNELQEQVDIFHKTLLESPLFASSSVAKELLEDRSFESNIKLEFTEQLTEEIQPISTDEEVINEPESNLEFNDINDFINQKQLDTKEQVIKKPDNNFDYSDINESIDQKVPQPEETVIVEPESDFEFSDFNELIDQKVSQPKETVNLEPESDFEFNNINEFIDQKVPQSEETVNTEPEADFEFNNINELKDQKVSQPEETVNTEPESHREFNDINEFIKQKTPQTVERNDKLEVETNFEIDGTDKIEELESPKTSSFLSTKIEEIESEVAKEVANEERISNQAEEKRAVLENSNTDKAAEKPKKGKNIQPEINIEEEIRRILS